MDVFCWDSRSLLFQLVPGALSPFHRVEKGLGEWNAKILVFLKAFSSKGEKMPSILYKPRIRVMHCYVMCLFSKFHSIKFQDASLAQ